MNCYVFTAEPRGVTYAQLVDFSCHIASTMLLIVQNPDTAPGPRIREKLEKLKGFQLNVVLGREWPGTVLLSKNQASIYSYRVASGLSELLKAMASRLFEWVNPEAPEDICFLRDDRRAILTTTSHEEDAYLLITAAEFDVLRANMPDLASILQCEGAE